MLAAKLDGSALLRRYSLRCLDASEELAYKEKVHIEVLQPLLFSALFLCVYLVLCVATTLSEDLEIFGLAQVVYYASYGLLLVMWAAICLLLGFKLMIAPLPKCIAWDWELAAAGSVVLTICLLPLMNAWFAAKLMGQEPYKAWKEGRAQTSDFLLLLQIVLVVSGSCIYIPIRTFIAWIIPSCGLCTYVAAVVCLGSPFPELLISNSVCLALACFMSFCGARRMEREDRLKWHSMRTMKSESGKLQDVKRAYQQVASIFCDIVVMLGKDGCVQDDDQDDMHVAYFGKRMRGQPFAEVLKADDTERFEMLLQTASDTEFLQSMPATLNLGFSSPAVQLIVVDVGPTSDRDTAWLVGVHATEQSQTRDAEIADIIRNSLGDERDLSQESFSLPTTTETGMIFKELNPNDILAQGDDVGRQLKDLAIMGSREHWLVKPHDIELLPEKVIGSGGFGVVVAGRLRGTPVAVKLPRCKPSWKFSHLASIANEIRLQRHIRHPNIVLWHGACIEPQHKRIALVHELVHGIQMDEYVQTHFANSRDLERRLKLLLDITCALRYLHSQNPAIVHSDLTTSNILVESWVSGPRAKLLDFGLSQLVTKCAEPQGGTLEWMAPELLCGGTQDVSRLAPSADVFSFGRLAYFTCTGQSPLAAYQRSLVLRMAKQGRIVPLRWPDGAPFLVQCRALCERCFHISPGQRPSMKAVHVELLSWQPQPTEQDANLDASQLATFIKGVTWAEGVKILETSPLTEMTKEELDATARIRGQAMLDVLEAMVKEEEEQGSPAVSPSASPAASKATRWNVMQL